MPFASLMFLRPVMRAPLIGSMPSESDVSV